MSLLQNNPNYKAVMDYVSMCGNDPQKAFYQMAKEKGIDPNDILSQFM